MAFGNALFLRARHLVDPPTALHAGHRQHRRVIYPTQDAVGHRRSHEGAVGLAPQADVVGEAPRPGQERDVLAAQRAPSLP